MTGILYEETSNLQFFFVTCLLGVIMPSRQ